MKKLFLALLLLLVPFSQATAGSTDNDVYWYCTQVGYFKESAAIAISNVDKNSKDIAPEHMEEFFYDEIKEKTYSKFRPEFDASCHYHKDKESADKEVKKVEKKAGTRGIWVIKLIVHFEPSLEQRRAADVKRRNMLESL